MEFCSSQQHIKKSTQSSEMCWHTSCSNAFLSWNAGKSVSFWLKKHACIFKNQPLCYAWFSVFRFDFILVWMVDLWRDFRWVTFFLSKMYHVSCCVLDFSKRKTVRLGKKGERHLHARDQTSASRSIFSTVPSQLQNTSKHFPCSESKPRLKSFTKPET